MPSDSLVPADDPTLLFTNAGMNQFKDVFLGTGERPYLRVADTQKCLRVSGKHNDLEEVGIDTYHHTFFEMLGNWSFGDYFKKEAVRWAWELLVEEWGLEPSRLYATVHEGDEALGVGPDDEAAEYWRTETGIDPDHVLFCGSKDNFWMMGDTGPCGPCSEIHIDLRPDAERRKQPGVTLVNADDPRVMEIWNLVFIQYNALDGGKLETLPAKHVDTGMGFERVVAVLQGKKSNYDTDLFAPLLKRIAALSPRDDITYDELDVAEDEKEGIRVAMRVIADHARAITFTISDGVTPGNVGRGYVIRRILRRAVRFGYQTLEMKEPFLYRLVETLANQMSGTFPELARNREHTERVIKAEEESFLQTLGTGLEFFGRVAPYVKSTASGNGKVDDERLLSDRRTVDLLKKAFVEADDATDAVRRFRESSRAGSIPGEIAFLLHDTYGFPVDLTQLMAREEGLDVDMSAYGRLMQAQRDRARNAANFGGVAGESGDWMVVGTGNDSVFEGYETVSVADARILRARSVESADGRKIYQVVLDRTPFYAESGGQVGDTGELIVGDQTVRVYDTQRFNGALVHFVAQLPAEMDAPVVATVDAVRRRRIMKHHTATHLLHAALREVLGKHVAQKGSLVAPDHLRFDFSHFERVTSGELETISRIVNEKVQENIAQQEERNVPVAEALERGAMALFGEKYGDLVRMITFDPSFSVELCGGTHVDATGEIGVFTFRSEGSVAAGIRRVEALAGVDALSFMGERLEELDRVRGQFKGIQRPTDEEVAELIEQNRKLSRELENARTAALASRLEGILQQAATVDGVRVAVGDVGQAEMDTLRGLGEEFRSRAGQNTVGVLGARGSGGEKAYLVAIVTDDVIEGKGLKAGDIVGRVARLVGGGGGGRPGLATAGGREPENLKAALDEVPQLVKGCLGAA